MRFLFCFLLIVHSQVGNAQSINKFHFANFKSVRDSLGFRPYYSKTPVFLSDHKKLRVAVFGSQFAGVESKIGTTLPADTIIHTPLIAVPSPTDAHSTYMAELMMAFLTDEGRAPQFSPELHLYDVFPYSNFENAVNDAILNHIDVIVFEEVMDFGGNADKSGIFNPLVSKATNSGIIWINSAGNLGQSTFHSAINNNFTNSDWVNLPDRDQSLEFTCFRHTIPSNLDTQDEGCNIRIALTWPSFSDNIDQGTDHDLDLYVYDEDGALVGKSELRQSSEKFDPSDLSLHLTSTHLTSTHLTSTHSTSLYPREFFVFHGEPGKYKIKVKNISKNFKDSDRLTLVVSGSFLSLKHFDQKENIFNPADNPDVISVGASDYNKSSISTKNQKPDLQCPSSIVLDSGDEYRGSSNCASIVASGVILLKSVWPNLNVLKIKSLLSQPLREGIFSVSNTTEELGFTGTGPDQCFEVSRESDLKFQFEGVKTALKDGGVFVNSSDHKVRIMVKFEPSYLDEKILSPTGKNALIATKDGFILVTREFASQMHEDHIEIFQTPRNARLCGELPSEPLDMARAGWRKNFHMPFIR
jgi:hypothetical protein